MWYVVTPGSKAWARPFSNTAVPWDTTKVSNGPKTIECATESGKRGARAAEIVVVVNNPEPSPTPVATATPVVCADPTEAPKWVAPANGATVSGIVTLRCDLDPATDPSCADSMWYIVTPESKAWARPFSDTAVQWDTTKVANGTKTIECATQSGRRGAFAVEIVVEVKN